MKELIYKTVDDGDFFEIDLLLASHLPVLLLRLVPFGQRGIFRICIYIIEYIIMIY
jgi:hypothetical protein